MADPTPQHDDPRERLMTLANKAIEAAYQMRQHRRLHPWIEEVLKHGSLAPVPQADTMLPRVIAMLDYVTLQNAWTAAIDEYSTVRETIEALDAQRDARQDFPL